MREKLFIAIDNNYDEIISLRRHLHENPELSFEEVETPKLIADYHRNLGHEVREHVGGRGVVAILKGNKPGKTVALRADFDALPIQDEKDVPYKSKIPGAMHACGHDGHSASLLGLAKSLNSIKDQLFGKIIFIHQHAEELAPGGAIAMIEDGCLDGVDYIFGTHLWATEPLGKIQYKSGPIMAAADRFEITIQGQGGHGAKPHETKDSIVIGSQIVLALQQIVSRRVSPMDAAVISVGSFEAKNAFNVIADSVKIVGTARSFNEKVQDLLENEIQRVVKGICLAGDVTGTVQYKRGYPALVNHHDEAIQVAALAEDIPGVIEVEDMIPQMGGEDFAYYLHHVKGAFFFTGAKNPTWEKAYPHHHPKFDIDENALLISAKLLGDLALYYTSEM
ncbi:amidohydrolase [Anaerobacillus isosaccharinicus]|uniref:Amidohydrolase n=1 Tax=Anaerobacillus isosaccharinicus TaxID=1532552 RepID=A0A1S2KU22_9BACI|nr:amidohydrolase [Anaerobacillus isosaccharinicus]MBA5585324.1 amidohydrolase [Anaerobacillus isosaccharinicus]QOY36350.1 amidohydrolase [Anaerobacillus isosaccharinicus]